MDLHWGKCHRTSLMLSQVMAWCHQASSYYLSQFCPSFMSPYGCTRPQWVEIGDSVLLRYDLLVFHYQQHFSSWHCLPYDFKQCAWEAILKNIGICITWICNVWWYNHNKTKHSINVCIFYGLQCNSALFFVSRPQEVPYFHLGGARGTTEEDWWRTWGPCQVKIMNDSLILHI